MKRIVIVRGVAAVFLCVAHPSIAQQTVADAPKGSVTALDRLLSKPVTFHVNHVTLRTAIDLLASRAKIAIAYRQEWLDATGRIVTVDAVQQPLGEVLSQILNGTAFRVVVTSADVIALKLPPLTESVSGGVIAGLVTNSKTKQPLKGASVTLDDTTKTGRTNDSGQYRFVNVSAGSHRISVRAIGFARQTKLVSVEDDKTSAVDFSLEGNINTLDQVVVTATGAQRYRELGHVVAQINADSLVREAPITSLSELLTARIPGLQVMGTNGGSVGGEVALRLRGTTTTSLDPQPIVIVDGVRYKNTNTINGLEDQRPNSAEPRSPLNDLNVNDIESVEVVKGPSASTLYGPDAANGVILVTTKRGRVGKPQWHVYAYPDLSTLNVGSTDSRINLPTYQGWGHIPNTNTVYQGQCTLEQQAINRCILDSLVVVQNPADDPALSVVAKQRRQWHSGVSVSGGTSTFSYFFSGNRDSQTGAYRLSPVAETILRDRLGEAALSSAVRSPNTQQTVNVHANVSTALSTTSNVAFVGSYTQATQGAMKVNVFGQNAMQNAFVPGRVYSAEDSLRINTGVTRSDAFLQTSQMQVGRLTAALNGGVQLRPWLNVNGSVGTDLDNTTDRAVRPQGSLSGDDGGEADDYRRSNISRDAHIGMTAVAHPGRWSFRTSAGTDYGYINLDGLNTSGQNLAPGSSDLSTASETSVQRKWMETVQLGGYGEEVIGLNDRVFLTGSLRLDGSTSFGDAYAPKPFPKVGLSWVVSDEPALRQLHAHGLDELRLRYSYGAASRYPTSAMKWGRIAAQNVSAENTTIAGFSHTSGANPNLRPERSAESEYGADANVASIVHIELTWYNRRTNDGLQLVSGPAGALPGWLNVGDLSAHGFEATVGVKVFESTRATLDMDFSYADQRNKVLSIGDGVETKNVYGGTAVGYPLGAVFGARTIGAVDSAGGAPDGFIDESEIISAPFSYLGTMYAPRTYTFNPRLTLFGGRVRMSTLVDRQSGGVQFDPLGTCANNFQCPASFLKTAPLLDRARIVANNLADWITTSDFTRWRELALTTDLPLSFQKQLHLSRASVSLQVRNLALWTPGKTPDPESVPGLGTQAYAATTNTGGAIGVPQPRVWTIRVDIAP